MTSNRTLKRDTLKAERAWAKAHPHSIKTMRYRIVTPTLRRLERAAMEWFDFCLSVGASERSFLSPTSKVFNACSAHRRAQIAVKLHAQSQAGGKRRKRG